MKFNIYTVSYYSNLVGKQRHYVLITYYGIMGFLVYLDKFIVRSAVMSYQERNMRHLISKSLLLIYSDY